jgi:hypothetical protein
MPGRGDLLLIGAPHIGVYVVPQEVIAAHLEGEAVLLNLSTRSYFRLNDTASAVWRGVERGMDRAGLLEELCSIFDVERDLASPELDRLLADLLTRGLITAAPVPG